MLIRGTMTDNDRGTRARLDALAGHPLGRVLFKLVGRPENWAALLRAEGRQSRRMQRLEARRLAGAGLVASRRLRRHHSDLKDLAPHPSFDAHRYRDLFPDADRDGVLPLAHFLTRAEAQDAALPNVLRAEVERLPTSLRTGLGTALFVQGWAYPRRGRIRFLDIVIGDTRYPVTDHSQPRPDVLDAEMAHDPEGHSFFSGFEAVLALPAVTTSVTRPVRLRLVTRDGAVLEQDIGTLTLLPGDGRAALAVTWPGQGPRVAICMATHQPPLDLFAAQIASIKAQTYENWICIVSDDASSDVVVERMASLLDDPRFVFLRNRDRLDFYGNFERALRAVPADADAVALSDQDDRWHDDKIETLLGALDAEAQLVYADVRIVDTDGRTRSETFWVTRRNNFTSLPSLMAANTVMGASSLFRAALLKQILPFPERLGAAYHDHWIGLNALAAGTIRYVDRALHDYVQHGGNVIGHKRDADAPGLAAAGRAILSALRHRGPLRQMLRDIITRATLDRQSLVAQKVVLARILLLRHPGARPAVRRTLERLSGLSRLAPALRERLLAAIEKRPTLNHEGHFLRAVLISRTRQAAYRAFRTRETRRIRQKRYIHGLRHLMTSGDPAAPIDFRHSGTGRDVAAFAFGHVGWTFHKISPLTLRVFSGGPRRVNLLLATINFDYLFGGYIGMFNLALRLHRDGHAVRIVLLEETDVQLSNWRSRIARYPGLDRLFDVVELAYRYDRSMPLDVSPEDRFVATSGWSAHVAHKAEVTLGHERFLFLIQEYEPFFGPMNTNTALLRQAYDFPQFGLFSTAILRDYFAANRIGLFEEEGGEARSAVFSNAIQRFSPNRAQLERRSRRLLFYARPEDHAARNMFEMGIAALVQLFSDPAIAASGWTAHGIGSIATADRLELVTGIFLQMVPKTSLQGYIDMLPGFDVGLSLMLTPHPSLVPLEMAAAGLPTVTNTFANKTVAALTAISPNLIGVKPTLDGIVQGLREAIARAEDIDSRLAGAAAMTWPTDWDHAFPADTMDRVNSFLRD